jgi:hypothetical protein
MFLGMPRLDECKTGLADSHARRWAFTERLYCSQTAVAFLKQLKLDGQIFLRVLSKIIDEFDGF